MAVQEFDRPVRSIGLQSRRIWEQYLSLALLIAAIGFLGYTVLSLPGPVNDLPLPSRQLSDIPR